MIKLIKDLFRFLSPEQRRNFYTLQLLVIIMSVAEITGIAFVGLFVTIISNNELISTNNILIAIYNIINAKNSHEFIFFFGLFTLIGLAIGSFISIYTIWRMTLFAAKTGSEIGDRLFAYYLNQPWLFHVDNNSSFLTKQIATEAGRTTNRIIQPLLSLNGKVVLATFMSCAALLYNPALALVGLCIFTSSYILIFKLAKIKLTRNGQLITQSNAKRFSLMSEGFGGIRDLLLSRRQENLISQFRENGKTLAKGLGNNQTIAQAPRYLVELVALGSVIALVLFLLKSKSGNLLEILPILSIYGLVGLKLLPTLQAAYGHMAHIKGALPAFQAIQKDLEASLTQEKQNDIPNKNATQQLTIKNNILLKDIYFTYPGKKDIALNNITINISANNSIGIVGPSGSGKSTILDILLGYIQPQSGKILVDGNTLDNSQMQLWKNSLGYVPQSIFLADASILENIAFGLPIKKINLKMAQRAAKLAHLDEFINKQNSGIHCQIGEHGAQLSGGQRQRIGIARALYNNANILIFDEATSALDGIAEKLIMEAIHEFSEEKTIIMIAHRLNTVKNCNQIYYIENGQVSQQGTYDELLESNADFKKMALH
ncbi:MAG: ABC transporter ATP-binding protein [Desulfobacteraceae bacterium]|nr:ABC transporter ATP-binding protein [Desulfobacteraceae bacterium]